MVLAIFALLSTLLGKSASLLNTVLSWLKDTIFFILGKLPKPIQLIIVFVLFLAVGGLMNHYFISPTHICIESTDAHGNAVDGIYKVGWMDGMSLSVWPMLEGVEKKVTIEYGNDAANSSNIIFIDRDTEDPIDGVSTESMMFLAETNQVKGAREVNSLRRLPPEQQFEKNRLFGMELEALNDLWGYDQLIIYDICSTHTLVEGTCILRKRGNKLGKSNAGDPCIGYPGGLTDNEFGYPVGEIQYIYTADKIAGSSGMAEDVITVKLKDRNVVADLWATLYDWFHPNVDYDGSAIARGCQEDSSINYSYIRLEATLDGVRYEDNDAPWIYNTGITELMVTERDIGDVTEGTLFFELQAESIQNFINDFVVSGRAVKQNYTGTDFISYGCNDGTTDLPFDTELYVMGIPLFSTTTVAFLLIFSFLGSFFMFLVSIKK